MTKTIRTENELVARFERDAEVTETRKTTGTRRIGHAARIWRRQYEAAPQHVIERGWGFYLHREAGDTVYALNTDALRDGEVYGASSGDREFATFEQARIAAEKYLKDATKRTHKKVDGERFRAAA